MNEEIILYHIAESCNMRTPSLVNCSTKQSVRFIRYFRADITIYNNFVGRKVQCKEDCFKK